LLFVKQRSNLIPHLYNAIKRKKTRVAISALAGVVGKGESAFSKMLLLVSARGLGQALLSVRFWHIKGGAGAVEGAVRWSITRIFCTQNNTRHNNPNSTT
jgi:hypothetical protein